MTKVPVTTEEHEDDVIIDVKSSITLALSLKKSAELTTAARDVAAFINTVREMTEEDYALDVRVQVGPTPEAGRNSDGTAVVGFNVGPTQADEEYEEEDKYAHCKPLN